MDKAGPDRRQARGKYRDAGAAKRGDLPSW